MRYGTTPERREMIRKLHDEIAEIEFLIFTKLDIGPARLNDLNVLEPAAKVVKTGKDLWMIPLKIPHLLRCIRAESLKLKGVDCDNPLTFEL